MTLKSTYWVASHITGIFEIFNDSNDLLMQGSKGAGFCLDRGVTTTVIRNPEQEKCRIFFNDIPINFQKADISMYIINNLLDKESIRQLSIYHYFDVPIGAGFGASAAGALGLAFAVNSVLKLKKNDLFLWQIAHKAEITCGGGLGDILGLYQGGLEIRSKPGAPNIGLTTSFKHFGKEDNLFTINLGQLSTKDIITSNEKKKLINKAGKEFLQSLTPSSSFKDFLLLCSKFTHKLQLYSDELNELMNNLVKFEILTAQIMLGDGIFFLSSQKEKIKKILSDFGFDEKQYKIETICSKTIKKIR